MPIFKSFHASAERQNAGGHTGRTVVQVTGDVDVATSPLLAAAVARALEGKTQDRVDLVVDLAHVRFIDASGINVLVTAAHRARAAGGSLALRSPSRSVRRMLGILKLDGVLVAE